MLVLPRRKLLPEIGDQGECVTATSWGQVVAGSNPVSPTKVYAGRGNRYTNPAHCPSAPLRWSIAATSCRRSNARRYRRRSRSTSGRSRSATALMWTPASSHVTAALWRGVHADTVDVGRRRGHPQHLQEVPRIHRAPSSVVKTRPDSRSPYRVTDSTLDQATAPRLTD
jgi:hypothetical protein